MTGEMSKQDVTRDAYPLHFAIARALNGRVEPFDVYRGPYIRIGHDRIWIADHEKLTNYAVIWNETTGETSSMFWPHGDLAEAHACYAAVKVCDLSALTPTQQFILDMRNHPYLCSLCTYARNLCDGGFSPRQIANAAMGLARRGLIHAYGPDTDNDMCIWYEDCG
jgi:hypothetical protein